MKVHIVLGFVLVLFLSSCGEPYLVIGGFNISASKENAVVGETIIINISGEYFLRDSLGKEISFKAKFGICFVDKSGQCKINLERSSESIIPTSVTLRPDSDGAVYGLYSTSTGLPKQLEHSLEFTATEAGNYTIKGFFLEDTGGTLLSSNAQLSDAVTVTFE
jgi:hypothetical protein